jgi:antirestriction protein ArdC
MRKDIYDRITHKIISDLDHGIAEKQDQKIPFLNGEQVGSLPDHDSKQRMEPVEEFFKHIGATIQHGGNSAYYEVGTDHIQIPLLTAFETLESYYVTLAHESIHSTRHPARLNRYYKGSRNKKFNHAMEELVAELGTAYLCADLGITPEVRSYHAVYILPWFRVFKADKDFIFMAATRAQKAVEYLHSRQPLPIL